MQQKREKFIVLYESHFGRFPAKTKSGIDAAQAGIWFEFIDALKDEDLEPIFSRLSTGESKPYLSAFRSARRDLRRETGGAYRPVTGGECRYCGGGGWMLVPACKSEKSGYVIAQPKAGPIYAIGFPCSCRDGEIAARQSNTTGQERQAAHEWRRRFPDDGDASREITRLARISRGLEKDLAVIA